MENQILANIPITLKINNIEYKFRRFTFYDEQIFRNLFGKNISAFTDEDFKNNTLKMLFNQLTPESKKDLINRKIIDYSFAGEEIILTPYETFERELTIDNIDLMKDIFTKVFSLSEKENNNIVENIKKN